MGNSEVNYPDILPQEQPPHLSLSCNEGKMEPALDNLCPILPHVRFYPSLPNFFHLE